MTLPSSLKDKLAIVPPAGAGDPTAAFPERKDLYRLTTDCLKTSSLTF
ncbi:MAG: hypothetical protein QXL94_00595 [Candidatus Parvarchaeum sp.]